LTAATTRSCHEFTNCFSTFPKLFRYLRKINKHELRSKKKNHKCSFEYSASLVWLADNTERANKDEVIKSIQSLARSAYKQLTKAFLKMLIQLIAIKTKVCFFLYHFCLFINRQDVMMFLRQYNSASIKITNSPLKINKAAATMDI
jgi:hypothetical protein